MAFSDAGVGVPLSELTIICLLSGDSGGNKSP